MLSSYWWGFVTGWAVGTTFLVITVMAAAVIRLYGLKATELPDPLPPCDVCGVVTGFHDQVKHQTHQAMKLIGPRP